jgi:hypothetical protein
VGLVVVAALHLLTTAGAWEVTDHGEQLLVAQRLLTKGTLHLWDPGDPPLHRPRELLRDPTRPVLSRFAPVPSLTFLPLLWLDGMVGWAGGPQFGHLVHLQGHLMVLLGLLLLGHALLRNGVSVPGTAMAVVLVGLAWPTWSIARRVGPEPVLFFLVAAFVASQLRQAPSSPLVQAAVCAVLPWVHATGPMMAFALALATALDAVWRGRSPRGVATVAGGALLGIASYLFFWNHLYEGDWLQGGYGAYAVKALVRRDPLPGLWSCVEGLILGAPVLLGVAFFARSRPDRTGLRTTALTLSLLLPLLMALTLLFVFNLPLSRPESTRRLACLLPAWGAVVGEAWDALAVSPVVAQALVGLSVVPGAIFLPDESNLYFTSHGVFFFPWILWLNLLNLGVPWPLVALPVGVLLAVLVWSVLQLRRLLGAPGP